VWSLGRCGLSMGNREFVTLKESAKEEVRDRVLRRKQGTPFRKTRAQIAIGGLRLTGSRNGQLERKGADQESKRDEG